MIPYLTRRAVHSAVALLGLLIAVFFLARLTGDPTDALHLHVTDITRLGGDVQIRLRPTRHTGGQETTGRGS